MKTRALFETLGFQQDFDAITDQRPAYYYDFGNFRLTIFRTGSTPAQ